MTLPDGRMVIRNAHIIGTAAPIKGSGGMLVEGSRFDRAYRSRRRRFMPKWLHRRILAIVAEPLIPLLALGAGSVVSDSTFVRDDA